MATFKESTDMPTSFSKLLPSIDVRMQDVNEYSKTDNHQSPSSTFSEPNNNPISDETSRPFSMEFNSELSPISIINEIMLNNGEQIYYDLFSVKGKVHSPEYTVRAKYKDTIVYGSGSSKKEAKRNAAIKFLDTLNEKNNKLIIPSILFFNKKKVIENYIGMLQNLCVHNGWDLPKYECHHKNVNKYKTWSVICSLQLYKAKGEHKNKKTAKVVAARLMYNHMQTVLKDNTSSNSSEYQMIENSDELNISVATLVECNSSDNSMISNTSITNNSDNSMVSNTSIPKKSCIDELKNCDSIRDLGISSVNFLNAIGEEEDFQVIYSYNFLMFSGKYQVVVKLLFPIILTHTCIGETLKETQETAAFEILLFFKLLLADQQ